MNRIKLFVVIFFIVTSIQSQKKEVKINSTKVSDQIYMLKGQEGANIRLFVGNNTVFIIDDQFAPSLCFILI